MRKIIPLFFAQLLFSRCTINENDELATTPLFWILLIVAIILFFIIGASANKKQKQTKENLKKKGIEFEKLIYIGKYAGGHISLDKEINRCCGYTKDGLLQICEQPFDFEMPKEKASIPLSNITAIQALDKTTMEKKVTLGRVLLVGVFALAWKKKKKNELAFLGIEWKDGKFEHNTIFSFEGSKAMEEANTARNKLIKACS